MLRNLTPHAIALIPVIRSEETGEWVDDPLGPTILEPEGVVPRVEMERRRVAAVPVGAGDDVLMVTVNQTVTGQVIGLPDQTDDWLIVSRQVAEARPDRGDLLVVDETIRDEQGRVVGARALASLARPEALEEFLRRRRTLAPERAL